MQYGPNVQSIATYMSAYQFVPYARLAEFFSDLFGVALSPATALRMVAATAASVEARLEAIKQAVIGSAHAHFDETGLRCEKMLMKDAMDEIGILPLFNGKAVHDAWAPYFSYLCSHSLRNAHHVQELPGVYERYGEAWAKRMSDLLLNIEATVDRRKARDCMKLKRAQLRPFGFAYQAIITVGRQHHGQLCNRESASPRHRGRVARRKGKNLL